MSVPKRFGVLRFFATLLKVIAWIVLVFSILGAIAAVVAGSSPQVAEMLNTIPGAANQIPGGGMTTGIIFGIGILLYGLIIFLALYVGGDQIHLSLAVEENTRLTAALLLRMHQETGAADAQAYGGGGFSNEPYDN
jgi:hypothetical protein